MKISNDGKVIKFDHVRHMAMEHELHKDMLIIVEFDGEPDFWYLEPNSTLEQGLGELEIYYRRDWAGSGRKTLPVKAYKFDYSSELKIER